MDTGKWLLWLLCFAGAVPVVFAAAVGAMIAFGGPSTPPPLAAVGEPMRRADFSRLSPIETFRARDGTALAYRTYSGGDSRLAVLIHGSSGPGASLHVLAKALASAGITSIVPDIRGHGQSGRIGDIDYVGQLDDDLADLAGHIRAAYKQAPISLVGFSSGGGFAIRVAGGKYSDLFNRYVLVSPVLHYSAPTTRPNSGGWASVGTARIIGLSIAERFGISSLSYLTVLRLAGDPETALRIGQTLAYSQRLAQNFGAPPDYLEIFRRAQRPMTVLIGADDALLYADRYVPLLKPVNANLVIEVLPGLGHVEMTLDPHAAAMVAHALKAK